MTDYERFKQWVKESQTIVFFGGAGTSTGSGIPDFRSPGGLYADKKNYSPEYLLSHDFLMEDPEGFSRYYKSHLIHLDAEPRELHEVLVQWENEGKLLAVITQNIDGLHQKAGSGRVFEIHGTLLDHYCMDCHKAFPLEEVLRVKGVYHCLCGGVVRPDVTLYGESLPQNALFGALEALSQGDLLIIAGTSLAVWPAAGIIDSFKGGRSVVINREMPQRKVPDALYFAEDLNHFFRSLLP